MREFGFLNKCIYPSDSKNNVCPSLIMWSLVWRCEITWSSLNVFLKCFKENHWVMHVGMYFALQSKYNINLSNLTCYLSMQILVLILWPWWCFPNWTHVGVWISTLNNIKPFTLGSCKPRHEMGAISFTI